MKACILLYVSDRLPSPLDLKWKSIFRVLNVADFQSIKIGTPYCESSTWDPLINVRLPPILSHIMNFFRARIQPDPNGTLLHSGAFQRDPSGINKEPAGKNLGKWKQYSGRNQTRTSRLLDAVTVEPATPLTYNTHESFTSLKPLRFIHKSKIRDIPRIF
jgi:hypothetical protein